MLPDRIKVAVCGCVSVSRADELRKKFIMVVRVAWLGHPTRWLRFGGRGKGFHLNFSYRGLLMFRSCSRKTVTEITVI